jgi:hypothetical protein
MKDMNKIAGYIATLPKEDLDKARDFIEKRHEELGIDKPTYFSLITALPDAVSLQQEISSEILPQKDKDEYNLNETTKITEKVGSNFSYDFSGENKQYELIVSYDSDYSSCEHSDKKIILINYEQEVTTKIDTSVECEFLKIPESRTEEEESAYLSAINEYEGSLAYELYNGIVSDSTHYQTDYTSCGYGYILLLAEEVGNANPLDTKVMFFSDIDGYLGQSKKYEINGTIFSGLEYNLSNGEHNITSVSLLGCNISTDTKKIKIVNVKDLCDEDWDGFSEPEASKERWVEGFCNILPGKIQLSALGNIPSSISDVPCYRFNINRWAEKNNSTIVNPVNSTNFINVNGRVNPMFIFNSIKSGRCITFTKGEFDNNAIKIHVDFLKDPDDPCCSCKESRNGASNCDEDCPYDGWVTTGRFEENCDCCTQDMFDRGECSKVNCVDPGCPNPPNGKTNEWVDKDDQPILQPEFPGCWKRQIDPDGFNKGGGEKPPDGNGPAEPGGDDEDVGGNIFQNPWYSGLDLKEFKV